jgi:16S rRNA U1498 N3-methylase RsmE
MGGDPPGLDRPIILIGPEGGWDDSELAVALPRVVLGSAVLRSETAAVAAGMLLCALRAGVVNPAG